RRGGAAGVTEGEGCPWAWRRLAAGERVPRRARRRSHRRPGAGFDRASDLLLILKASLSSSPERSASATCATGEGALRSPRTPSGVVARSIARTCGRSPKWVSGAGSHRRQVAQRLPRVILCLHLRRIVVRLKVVDDRLVPSRELHNVSPLTTV